MQFSTHQSISEIIQIYWLQEYLSRSYRKAQQIFKTLIVVLRCQDPNYRMVIGSPLLKHINSCFTVIGDLQYLGIVTEERKSHYQ